MAEREGIRPVPAQMRTELNIELGDRSLSMLDDSARFIIRRLVARVYAKGYDDGWSAGADDVRTDRQIERDRQPSDSGTNS